MNIGSCMEVEDSNAVQSLIVLNSNMISGRNFKAIKIKFTMRLLIYIHHLYEIDEARKFCVNIIKLIMQFQIKHKRN